jgi:NAD(P)-dependent dehydrogenase (short-subunit alcohol dehydrogenase family)
MAVGMDIKNKVVLITGASTGIGKAAALEFDRAGARVAIAARRENLLNELASGMRDALVLKTDLSIETQARAMVEKTVSHFGRIDILINNAVTSIVASSDRVRLEDLSRAFATNLLGPVAVTQQAVRHMAAQGSGHIINIGTPGFMIGVPFYATYVCSKAAFSAWTRTIQGEWAGTCIVVSEYFPGYTETGAVAESDAGPVSQDLVVNQKGSFLAKYFLHAKTGADVAKDLVALAKKPRPLVYSTFMERLGALVSNFPSIRVPVARRMAETARKKLGQPIFGGK